MTAVHTEVTVGTTEYTEHTENYVLREPLFLTGGNGENREVESEKRGHDIGYTLRRDLEEVSSNNLSSDLRITQLSTSNAGGHRPPLQQFIDAEKSKIENQNSKIQLSPIRNPQSKFRNLKLSWSTGQDLHLHRPSPTRF